MRAREITIGANKMALQTDNELEASITEIENMKQSHFRGGKDSLGLYRTPGKKHLKPLPGGTDLMYSVTRDNYGSYVQIIDPGIPGITKPSIVASLSLAKGDIPNSVQVGAITVDEDYRGRGLAKALYGIVLTIMKKTLISGDSQTPGGRRNWLSLASIPGVEIKGLLDLANYQLEKSRPVDNTIDQLMQLGGQFVAKDNTYTYWAFDVVPGNGQLTPAVKNKLSKLYGYDSTNLLMATWTGGQQDISENFADGKNPQDKGDSKRYGVPTKASVSTLRKVAKQGGRKGQLAHWMANMKSGKNKTNEAETDTPNAREISNQLRAAGYHSVGSGADATVFAKDDSHVIKILMPEDVGSKAEQVFRKFYEFSIAHQGLACVPRFNEVNTIDINGKDYTQIEMERLAPIEKDTFMEGLIWFLSDYTNTTQPWETIERELADPNTWKDYSPNYANTFAKTWQSLVENPASKKTYAMYIQLYNVMKLLYSTGNINKFGWDLHTANVMLRGNGQPVIIDPWFSDGTS